MPSIGPISQFRSDRYGSAPADPDLTWASGELAGRAAIRSRRKRGPHPQDILAILLAWAVHLSLSLFVIPHSGEASKLELVYYSFYNIAAGAAVGFYLLDRMARSGPALFLLRSSCLILVGTLINESVVEPVFFGAGPINGEGIYYGLADVFWTTGIFLLLRLAEWQHLLWRRMHALPEARGGPRKLQPDTADPACFFVRVAGETRRINAPDILYLEADRDFTRLVCTNGEHFVSESLKSLEGRSAGLGVIRIHKSFAVNLCRVERMAGAEAQLGEVRVPVGRRYRAAVAQAWQSRAAPDTNSPGSN